MKSLRGAQLKARSAQVSCVWTESRKYLGASFSLPHLTREVSRPVRDDVSEMASERTKIKILKDWDTDIVWSHQCAGPHVNMAAIKRFFFLYNTEPSALAYL